MTIWRWRSSCAGVRSIRPPLASSTGTGAYLLAYDSSLTLTSATLCEAEECQQAGDDVISWVAVDYIARVAYLGSAGAAALARFDISTSPPSALDSLALDSPLEGAVGGK